jgi:DNA-binding response OmpR family regulator
MHPGPRPLSGSRGRARTERGMATQLVLIVDDNPEVCAVLVDALQGEGYAVDCATTVAEALTLVAEEKPGLALIDFALPDRSGDALAQELHVKGIPVAMMSGIDEERLRDLRYPYLAKPFQLASLFRLVNEAFAGTALQGMDNNDLRDSEALG